MNFYDILEISREATEDEIKASFRKLALKYHPDINQNDPESESKFKKINEAYQILSNSDERIKYDNKTFGFGFSSASKSSSRTRHHTWHDRANEAMRDEFFEQDLYGKRGFNFDFEWMNTWRDIKNAFQSKVKKYPLNLKISLTLDYEDFFIPVIKSITYKQKKTCPTCEGSGTDPKNSDDYLNQKDCSVCEGFGFVENNTHTLKVKIPVNVYVGSKLYFKGEGNESKGVVGDLEIEINGVNNSNERKFDEFLNMHEEIEIDFIDSVVGFKIEKEILGLKEKLIKDISPLYALYDGKLRITGLGIPVSESRARTDLIYTFIIKQPPDEIIKQIKEIKYGKENG